MYTRPNDILMTDDNNSFPLTARFLSQNDFIIRNETRWKSDKVYDSIYESVHRRVGSLPPRVERKSGNS